MQNNLSDLIDPEEWEGFVSEADLRGYSVRTYSGRGMYGKECLAIAIDGSQKFAAVGWACSQMPAWLELGGVLEDSMGLGIVVYWPDVSVGEFTIEDD